MSAEEKPLRRLAAQLDLDGRAHEIAPAHERLKLFEPAPTQLAGQQYLSIERDEEQP